MGFSKIKYMPYLNFYLDHLDEKRNDIHLLFWNRDLKEENFENFNSLSLHEFKCYQEDDSNKINKLINFNKYRKYAKKLIKHAMSRA